MRPGVATHSTVQLPRHAELSLTSAQSAEIIADYFSKISQEYSPLDLNNLPPNVRSYLHNSNQSLAPTLSIQDVYNRIIKAKKPN